MDAKERLTQLKQHFPYPEFRADQSRIIERVWGGKNTLALMPTGSGKSLCYQYPAKLQKKLVVVLSPLIALMQDQKAKAEELGISATEIHSNIGSEERIQRQKKLKAGNYNLLFVTPERFSKTEFRECLQDREIFLLAVDEAHCVSLWGHDFRPDYAKIPEIRKFLKNPPVLALTATATPDVQKDILEKIGIDQDSEIIFSGIERPNLAFNVHEVYGLNEKLEKFHELYLEFKKSGGSGSVILYSVLIHTVQQISRFLSSKKIPFETYHGDLQAHQRRRALNNFMSQPNSVMVATPAFGLGIDKKNIRQIFHFEVPSSLEEYFQQSGRAGRDGKTSECHFLFDEEDVHIQMEFIKWSHPEESYIRQIYQLISKNKDRWQQEGNDFLREQISFKNKKDFRVEAAVNILERWGCLEKSGDDGTWILHFEPTEEMFLLEDSVLLTKSQNVKLLEMLRYAKEKEQCRLQKIYKYFGHQGVECEQCDICRS
ncbi:MAG: RecQ family ATP-dependent DNA helicase [Bdellovibrionota bacterium]